MHRTASTIRHQSWSRSQKYNFLLVFVRRLYHSLIESFESVILLMERKIFPCMSPSPSPLPFFLLLMLYLKMFNDTKYTWNPKPHSHLPSIKCLSELNDYFSFSLTLHVFLWNFRLQSHFIVTNKFEHELYTVCECIHLLIFFYFRFDGFCVIVVSSFSFRLKEPELL